MAREDMVALVAAAAARKRRESEEGLVERETERARGSRPLKARVCTPTWTMIRFPCF